MNRRSSKKLKSVRNLKMTIPIVKFWSKIFVFKTTISPAFAFISSFHYEDIDSIGARIENLVFIRDLIWYYFIKINDVVDK